jgi:hypothetical protein
VSNLLSWLEVVGGNNPERINWYQTESQPKVLDIQVRCLFA